MMGSDIPEAIDPFLTFLMLKTELYGGMTVILWGMGARFMMRTVAV